MEVDLELLRIIGEDRAVVNGEVLVPLEARRSA